MQFSLYISRLTILLIIGWILTTQSAFCQLNPQMEAAARAQLAQRGITEEELRAKLEEKGIDLNAVSPDQLPSLQPTIEQAIREIEAAKRGTSLNINDATSVAKPVAAGPYDVSTVGGRATQSPIVTSADVQQVAAKAASEINVRVQDGATVQEAVSEALTDESTKSVKSSPRIYGQDIFRNKTLDVYRTTKDARPTENYILGVGDEVGVVIFGASQGDFRFVINEEGYIDPPGVGKIFLKGVPYGKARDLMYARFSRAFLFRSDQFVLSLATARTITVNIFGEVINRGSFSISAINTAFNAIAAAGGPDQIGSIRNIKVTRNGKSKNLDVYEFMNNPAIQYDYFLDNNDVIHIPVAEKVVTISGAVQRSAVYELKTQERLKDLVKFAGGVTPVAHTKRFQVKRHIAGNTILTDVDFEKNPDFELQNGDEILVLSIPQEALNKVVVSGDVDFPGTYALENNLDLAALAFKATPKRTARTDLAFVMRKLTDGNTRVLQVNLDEVMQGKKEPFLLEPDDRIMIFKQERYSDVFEVNLSGAVREPSTQPYNKGFKLAEYLLLSGGLREDATDFGFILRTNATDGSKTYLRINPIKAIQNPAGSENIPLEGKDNVRVYSTNEFRDNATIRVSGAVRNPVEVPYGTALTLSDALKMSGGLRIGAAKGKVDLYSVVLLENQASRSLAQSFSVEDDLGNIGQDVLLQPYDEIIVRDIPEFSLLRKVKLEGEVKYPGEYAILAENERISDLIKRAGGLTNEAFAAGGTLERKENRTGLIVTRIDQALKRAGSQYDIILLDGDVLNIPRSLDLVTIFTQNTDAYEVLSAERLAGKDRINVAYEPGKRGRWYVREFAGGRGDLTSYRKLKVHYPNGHIRKSIDFGFFALTPKVVPGSRIVLPLDPDKIKGEKPKKEKKEVDWNKVLTQLLSVATAAALLIAALR